MSDEILMLQEKNIPLLVVFGKNEKVTDTDYLDDVSLPLWRDAIFKLPAASHLVHIDQPEFFNQLMADFITDIFK